MRGVRCHDGIASPRRAFNDGGGDNVIVRGLTCQFTDAPSLHLSERLDVAHREQPRKTGWPGAAAPGLRQHGGWHDRDHFLAQERRMERPHPAIVPLGGDERACIVGDAGHYADRRDARVGRALRSSRRAWASPSARSSVVSAPCSRSQSAIACRPASRRRRCAAVSASQALKLVPLFSAARSIAPAKLPGSEMDRFARGGTSSMVAQAVGQATRGGADCQDARGARSQFPRRNATRSATSCAVSPSCAALIIIDCRIRRREATRSAGMIWVMPPMLRIIRGSPSLVSTP